MIKLTKTYIDSLATSNSAIYSAKGQINNLKVTNISEDGTLFFGECQGSAKNPYVCSYDFLNENAPVARCSCPSRQFPCKHTLALLYAYESGVAFTKAEIPQDILDKRNRVAKKSEKQSVSKESVKKKKDTVPTAQKLDSARRRLQIQLDGLDIAKTLAENILKAGILGLDAVAQKTLSEQAENLSSYYIGGIKNAFNDVLIKLNDKTENGFDLAMDSLIHFDYLINKAREYFKGKLNGDDSELLKLDTQSNINELIGHIWNKETLSENGLIATNQQLVQLAFNSYDDKTRREFVDRSYFCCLNDGNIYQSIVYRPYKASKHIKSGDTIFDAVNVPQMFIYPNDINQRISFDTPTYEPLTNAFLNKILSFSKTNFDEVIKFSKKVLMSPLSDKSIKVLLRPKNIIFTQTQDELRVQLVDENGVKLVLGDNAYDFFNIKAVKVLKEINVDALKDCAILVAIYADTSKDMIEAMPLSIISDKKIVRLAY